jgi:hypothetical protein
LLLTLFDELYLKTINRHEKTEEETQKWQKYIYIIQANKKILN